MSSNSSIASTSAGPSRLWRFFKKSAPLETNSNPSENTLVSPSPAPSNIHNVVPILNPPPAVYSICDSPHATSNAFDIFFGARPNQNQPTPRAPSSTSTLDPPPEYTPYRQQTPEERTCPDHQDQEPPTLARFLFLYGFIFFPFWILGFFVLVSPLHPTPDWEDGKTEHERNELLAIIRNTEKKWGRRCLYAFSILAITVILIAIIIRFVVHKSP